MSANVKIMGISDEVTTCEHCGKTNLKCTVALSIDGGDPVHYGRDCAHRALYGTKGTATDLKNLEFNGRLKVKAANWLAKGFSVEEVAKGVGMRHPSAVEIRNGQLHWWI